MLKLHLYHTRAFTLIEICIVIMILAMTLTYVLPSYNNMQQSQRIVLEKQKVFNFLLSSLQKIQYSNDSWSLYIHKNDSKWGISIQRKDSVQCNVLLEEKCLLETFSFISQAQHQNNQYNISSIKYFPASISTINARRMTFFPACFKLQLFNKELLFLISAFGRIRIDENYGGSISKCDEL